MPYLLSPLRNLSAPGLAAYSSPAKNLASTMPAMASSPGEALGLEGHLDGRRHRAAPCSVSAGRLPKCQHDLVPCCWKHAERQARAVQGSCQVGMLTP